MAGALRKTMVYLGLAEDERDDGYESFEDDDQSAARQDPSVRHERSAAVTPLPARTPVARVVRDVEVGALNRISTIHPRTYNEAKNRMGPRGRHSLASTWIQSRTRRQMRAAKNRSKTKTRAAITTPSCLALSWIKPPGGESGPISSG